MFLLARHAYSYNRRQNTTSITVVIPTKLCSATKTSKYSRKLLTEGEVRHLRLLCYRLYCGPGNAVSLLCACVFA